MHEIGRATGVEHQVVLTTSAYSARICKEQKLEIKDTKYIWREAFDAPPPWKNVLEKFIVQFFKASSKKKIRSITLIVWVLKRIEKMPKIVKKLRNFFLVLNKYQSVTHVSKCIFSRVFQKYSF